MNRRAASIAMMSVLLMVLAGCGGSAYQPPRTSLVEFSPEERAVLESSRGNAYRIQEGDVLKIAFPYLKELNQEGVIVLPDGAVSLIGVDRVELRGQTITQADSLITAAYAQDYVDPSLSVLVVKTKGRQVYVMGEVDEPGLYTLPEGGVDVLGAVSLAGGFTDDAAKGNTILVRVTTDGYLVQELDLSELQATESMTLAMVRLEAYDVVYVPKSRIGDFDYFARTVLRGIGYITRVAYDVRYLSTGGAVRIVQ